MRHKIYRESVGSLPGDSNKSFGKVRRKPVKKPKKPPLGITSFRAKTLPGEAECTKCSRIVFRPKSYKTQTGHVILCAICQNWLHKYKNKGKKRDAFLFAYQGGGCSGK